MENKAPQIIHLGSFGKDVVDTCGDVGISMKRGSSHLLITSQIHARENATVFEVFWVMSGLC